MESDTFVGCITIVIMIFLVPMLFLFRFSSMGNGEHNGYITALDQRGFIFRNYEVYFKTDNSSSQEDTYCIHRDDTEIIEKARQANRERKQVIITYHGVRGVGFGLCNTGQIDKIEFIDGR